MNPFKWHLWYAWRPVTAYVNFTDADEGIPIPQGEPHRIWLENVWRRNSGSWDYGRWVYSLERPSKNVYRGILSQI